MDFQAGDPEGSAKAVTAAGRCVNAMMEVFSGDTSAAKIARKFAGLM
jgi:hypothetical protein